MRICLNRCLPRRVRKDTDFLGQSYFGKYSNQDHFRRDWYIRQYFFIHLNFHHDIVSLQRHTNKVTFFCKISERLFQPPDLETKQISRFPRADVLLSPRTENQGVLEQEAHVSGTFPREQKLGKNSGTFDFFRDTGFILLFFSDNCTALCSHAVVLGWLPSKVYLCVLVQIANIRYLRGGDTVGCRSP